MMETLSREAAHFGWVLTEAQRQAFQVYQEELMAWNRRANLTAITDPEETQIKHFLDSLTCLLAFPAGLGWRVIDVGSGGGFPGLPVRIVRPDLSFTLLESVGKKVEFLRHMVSSLGLVDVTILHGRAEDWGHVPEHREGYHVVLARAVAELRVLAELTLPFCRVGGVVIAQKKAGIDEEIGGAQRAIAALGGTLSRCLPVALPGVEPRQLVVMGKVNHTPARYPRRAGIPQKRPLA